MLRIYIVILSAVLGQRVFATALDRTTLEHVRAFREAERAVAASEDHAGRVRLHVDARGEPQRTAHSVLLISGLFNSPKAMDALEATFVARGYNVVNLRLAGHYERDPSALVGSVRWAMWREQSREAFELARQLGHSVILAGHSTGALLVTWLAIDAPEAVGGLALFAPAFGLKAGLERLLQSNADKLVPYVKIFGRTLTLHAGREVGALARAFATTLATDEATALEYAGERLRNVPVWMGNTDFDHVIEVDAADAFFEAITVDARAARHHKRIAACHFILHDAIVSPLHLQWGSLHRSMMRTLFPD